MRIIKKAKRLSCLLTAFAAISTFALAEPEDLTSAQYAFNNSSSGINIPGWNTYDSASVPIHNAYGVVAVLDS